MSDDLLRELAARVGREVYVSDWLEITQQRIDRFADATGDHQWIHVNPARCAKESPWRTTIAHGYLTLALYPRLRGIVDAERPLYPGVKSILNYGLNRTRFPTAASVQRARSRAPHFTAVGKRVRLSP